MDVNGLVSLLIYLLIGGVIVYVVYWIVGMLSLPEPVKQAALLIVALVVLLWLLRVFGLV